ncbi:MAG: hypothetical protein WC483_01610 [Candidatus Paceibacterota bacterium]
MQQQIERGHAPDSLRDGALWHRVPAGGPGGVQPRPLTACEKKAGHALSRLVRLGHGQGACGRGGKKARGRRREGARIRQQRPDGCVRGGGHREVRGAHRPLHGQRASGALLGVVAYGLPAEVGAFRICRRGVRLLRNARDCVQLHGLRRDSRPDRLRRARRQQARAAGMPRGPGPDPRKNQAPARPEGPKRTVPVRQEAVHGQAS